MGIWFCISCSLLLVGRAGLSQTFVDLHQIANHTVPQKTRCCGTGRSRGFNGCIGCRPRIIVGIGARVATRTAIFHLLHRILSTLHVHWTDDGAKEGLFNNHFGRSMRGSFLLAFRCTRLFGGRRLIFWIFNIFTDTPNYVKGFYRQTSRLGLSFPFGLFASLVKIL